MKHTDLLQQFTIYICEDIKEHSEKMLEICSILEKEYSLNVTVFYSAKELLQCLDHLQQENAVFPNLILLDIELPGMDGITLGKQIREMDKDVFLVFVTSYIEYAVMGYEANAFRYLLKPLSEEVMRNLLIDIQKEYSKKKWITVKTRDGEMIATVVMFAYNVLVTLILTKKNRTKTLLLEIPALLVYAEFGIFLELIERIIGLDQYFIGTQKFTLTDLVSDFILFVSLILLSRTKVAKVKSIQLTIGEGAVLSLFCLFSPAIVVGLEWFEGMIHERIYKVVWICFMLILNVAVIYAIAHRKMAAYYRQLSENYKKEFEAEYSFFRDYKERQEDTIKFRHGWKNHMLLLQEMLEKEEYGKAESYFKDMTAAMPKSVHKIATGNELVDMVLSTKMNVLEENEITLQCKGALSEFNFMKYVDGCRSG